MKKKNPLRILSFNVFRPKMARPSPRARKTVAGEESIIPPGFTFESYLGKNGASKTGWRCGHIVQDPVHGDWRRCTKHCEKRDCFKHQGSGKHLFKLARADDPGFPTDFDQRLARVSMQRGIPQLQQSMAQFGMNPANKARASSELTASQSIPRRNR
jgi:hypothetical protein